ncbi:MAG: ArnT family glycosyltransferase [Acidobacteriota bacterium]
MTQRDKGRRVLRAVFGVLVLAATVSNISFAWRYAHGLSCWNLGIDTVEYDRLSRLLLQSGDLSSIPPFQPLGFIMLLAGLYGVGGGSVLAAKMTFCLLTAGAALGAWRLGVRFMGELEGVVAGLLVAWSPLLGAYSATVQYEVPVAFLLFWAVFCLLVPSLPDTRHVFLRYACGAVLLLAAILSRETVFAALPVLLLVPFANRRLTRRQKVTAALIVALIPCGGLGISTAWRYQATGRVIPISEKGDLALRFGNNPRANGTFNFVHVGMGTPSGWPFIASHPLMTLRLGVRKAGYYFGILYDGWNVPRPLALFIHRVAGGVVPYSWSLLLARGLLAALFTLAGAFLILRSPQLRGRLWPVPCVVALMMSVHLLYLSSCRFSIPSLPLILVLCAVAISHGLRLIWNSGWKTGIPTLGMALVAGAAGLFREPAVALTLEAEEFLCPPAQVAEDSRAANGLVARCSPGHESQRILFVPHEMLPRGYGRCEVLGSPFPPGQDAELDLAVVAEDRGTVTTLSHARLLVTGTGYRTLSSPFFLPEDLPVLVLVRSVRGGVSLDQVRLHGAWTEDQPGISDPAVVFDAANNPHSARNTGYGWGEPENWQHPGRVQWALGARSFLYYSGRSEEAQSLVFRASAFPPAGNQSLTVRFNERVIGQLWLSPNWRDYSVCIPSGLANRSLNLLELRHSAARSPFELNISADNRELAAAYQQIRILPGCSAAGTKTGN